MPRKSILHLCHAAAAQGPFLAFAVDPAAELAADAAEWVHLLTRGQALFQDGRNAKIIYDGEPVPLLNYAGAPSSRAHIDVNHANSKRTNAGEDTPAVGWIVELAARDDGLWGRVEWSARGKALIAERAYRGLSPEIFTDRKTGKVIGLAGASLTNRPALAGLTPLFLTADTQGDPMKNFLALAASSLALAATASEDELIAAFTAFTADAKARADQLTALAAGLGLAKDADAALVLATAQKLKEGAGGAPQAAVAELQAQLVTLTAELTTLKTGAARKAAEAFVDQALKEGRAGLVPSMREHYVERHMASAEGAAQVEKEIAVMPRIGGGTTLLPATPAKDASPLSEADLYTARLMGTDIKALEAVAKAEGASAA